MAHRKDQRSEMGTICHRSANHLPAVSLHLSPLSYLHHLQLLTPLHPGEMDSTNHQQKVSKYVHTFWLQKSKRGSQDIVANHHLRIGLVAKSKGKHQKSKAFPLWQRGHAKQFLILIFLNWINITICFKISGGNLTSTLHAGHTTTPLTNGNNPSPLNSGYIPSPGTVNTSPSRVQPPSRHLSPSRHLFASRHLSQPHDLSSPKDGKQSQIEQQQQQQQHSPQNHEYSIMHPLRQSNIKVENEMSLQSTRPPTGNAEHYLSIPYSMAAITSPAK